MSKYDTLNKPFVSIQFTQEIMSVKLSQQI